MLLGEGECLLDNVEIFAPGGANLCTNGTFETGLSTWTARGTHLRSTIEGNGFQSGHSLHVRASARGDTGLNRLRVPLAAVAPTNAPGTIRARVRWLCGWPEIILRTHGNWGECFGRMVLPGNLGTPGARNSRALSNAPPAVYEVHHEPVLPAGDQSVVVTCRVSDPDGIASLSLLYRIDPSTSQSTVPMRDDGTAGDAIAETGSSARPSLGSRLARWRRFRSWPRIRSGPVEFFRCRTPPTASLLSAWCALAIQF
ncbi:MAG TPA: hypothetical protein VNM37_07420, partial [Candidatus Dormibacteraeota bacterium]|nr:hypothetical protein [Candidatus Dormibacteraeota bacterium]